MKPRYARTAMATVATAALLSGCIPAADPTGPPETASPSVAGFGPGAETLDDPYTPGAGNGGYDVLSYDLELRYDPSTDRLTGRASIEATATANLTRFNLDLEGLETTAVTVDGAPATAEASGAELRVTPAANLPQGKAFTTVVTYGGVPAAIADGEGFVATADGAYVIGEPESASHWFPVNDHPRDKATYTIRITAPAELAALSNGVLAGRATTDGWTSWTWKVNQPMAPYLAMMAIGDYRVKESTHDGLPVITAVHRSLPTRIDALMARSPEVVDFLESRFGPYPFDAIGGIVLANRATRFALETQTRPLYGPVFFDEGRGDDQLDVIVHELAHQWYGDSVSVNEWRDLWLNEGFATFAAWLWFEEKGGDTVQEVFDDWYAAPQDAIWTQQPGNPPTTQLFNNAVYTRGGLTLQALRVKVGDAKFFEIMKTWATERAGTNATTADFVALAERISGQQLDEFFEQWLMGRVRPPRP